MQYLANTLRIFLERHFTDALRRDGTASVRPVLIGPPSEALQTLHDILTTGGMTNWNVAAREIVVLHVRRRTETRAIATPPHVLSRECQWDYAVTVRNSCSLVVILVDQTMWDNRPESLANTTETLGTLQVDRQARWLKDTLWKYLVQQVALITGNPEREARYSLQEASKQSWELDPELRNRVPWEIVNDLLSPLPAGLSPADTLALASGFPSLGMTGRSVRDAASLVKRLGDFIGEQGIISGFDRLRASTTAQNGGLQNDLRSMERAINSKVLSGSGFERAPAWSYRPGQPVPSWWVSLDTQILGQILDEATDTRPARVTLRCENALNPTPLRGEPLITASTAQLRVSPPPGSVLPTPSFSRKVGRAPATALPSDPNDDTLCIDANPAQHDRPIKYQADAPGFTAGSVDVLVLESFGCQGSARVRDADQNRPPAFFRAQRVWRQEIALPRAGAIDLGVYHSPNVATVRVSAPAALNLVRTTTAGNSLVPFVVEIEDGEEVSIALEDNAGSVIGQWTVHFTVNETTDTARNRYESLIVAHQTNGRMRIPRPQNRLVQRLEDAYIAAADSWKPILACWSGTVPGIPAINWVDPRLGDALPQIDPRPSFVPPQEVLDAREAVRQHLQAQLRTLGEIDLGDGVFAPLVEQYVQVYRNWLAVAPEYATWLDCIAVHAASWNAQAGRHIATSEPVALLLSPLHPLRIAWQCLAQQQLFSSLNQLCPAAGLLDPSSCPDTSACYLSQGSGSFASRTFFAVASDNPYWSILWNRYYLGQQGDRSSVLVRLSELGLESRGITGGFSSSQAKDSLVEITKLLPGRATLRVGIIGAKESSSACADGVTDWCIDQYDDDAPRGMSPFAVEVYDMRGASQPSPEQLALLSEKTQERVRWFKVDKVPITAIQDLIILDQLGAESPGGSAGDTRSPVGHGALCRVRIREDFQRAIWIKESRAATQAGALGGLAGVLQETVAAFEGLALQDATISQLQFQPNQQAIGSRLGQATYLAVTSSQIDPACIIRGATEQQGYLWDYELPGVLGGDEDSAGYYLVARPLEAMRRAIERSANLVAPTSPSVQDLLDEISRRGIPILKRLASGGSQSRGELGLLLAVRLLQDAFRGAASNPRLPVRSGTCIHLLLPVDPYERPFERVRLRLCESTTTPQRPDLLIFAIHLPDAVSPIQLKITPVEVKFRENPMSMAEQQSALQQAANLGQVLDAMWVQPAQSDLWATCGSALLAQCLDLAFRIYADETVHNTSSSEWAKLQERVIKDVLSRNATISINRAGRLLVFDGTSPTSAIVDVDGDGWQDSAILCRADAEVLLTGTGNLSQAGQNAVGQLDFSFPSCGGQQTGTQTPPANVQVTPVVVQPTPTLTVIQAPLPLPGLDDDDAQVPEGTGSSEIEKTEDTPASTLSEPDHIPNEHIHTPPAEERRGNTAVPFEVRQHVRAAFEGFIGNDAAIRRITNDLLRALIENPPHLSKNFLLTGQPSTGKTELARRMATALRLPFIKLDGRGVGSRERLFELVNGELNQQGLRASQVSQQAGLPVIEYPPLIIFIDEVHLVPRAVQESLLTMLEAADRTVTLQSQIARVNRATFIFATTRASDVDAAFRSRCVEVQLREYNLDEVAEIVNRRFSLGWPQEVYRTIAKLGRLVPRVAIELARELETEMTVSEHPEHSIEEHLEEVRKAREIDETGLTPTDISYLDTLERAARPVGEQAILNMLRTVDKDRIVDEVEPFLIRLGLIQLGTRGREITADGRRYLAQRRRRI